MNLQLYIACFIYLQVQKKCYLYLKKVQIASPFVNKPIMLLSIFNVFFLHPHFQSRKRFCNKKIGVMEIFNNCKNLQKSTKKVICSKKPFSRIFFKNSQKQNLVFSVKLQLKQNLIFENFAKLLSNSIYLNDLCQGKFQGKVVIGQLFLGQMY